jgi:hypothetical protein
MTAMDNRQATVSAEQLRALVREVLAEVAGKAPRPIEEVPPSPAHAASRGADAAGAWTVRIETDDDLHAFALRVLELGDNPGLRRDLIGGRIRFALARSATASAAAVHQVDKGAVTERTVAAAAKAGARLVLGPRAVLTPLARDKARALGVPIERPRGGLTDARAPQSTERPRGGLTDARAPQSTERPRGGLTDARST